jgi:hypothetical protein
MAIFPVILYVSIGLLLHRYRGHYNQSIATLTLGFLVVTGLAIGFGRKISLAGRGWSILLVLVLPIFTTRIMKNPLVLDASPGWGWDFFEILIFHSVLLSLALLIYFLLPRVWSKLAHLTALLMAAALVLAQLLVPTISPSTRIDVFVNNTAASRYLLLGMNPYPQAYENLYKEMYDYVPGFLYFPGTLLYQAPFLALFGDIRYGFVFAHLVIAAGLFWLARRRSWGEAQPVLFPLLWLSFPVTYFVLEQSWTDTVLVMLAVLSFVLVEKRWWRTAGAVLGFAFAFKQYAFVITGIGLAQILARAGWKKSLDAGMIAGVVFCAIVVPFAVTDWESFYRFTIANQVAPGLRKDAYNFTVFLFNKWGVVLPKGISTLITVGGIAGGILLAWRGKPRGGLGPAALGLFLAYGIAFFFGKWAFCNYYYLLSSFLLLYLVAQSGERESVQ